MYSYFMDLKLYLKPTPELCADEVLIWCVPIDRINWRNEEIYQFLTIEEEGRAKRFTFDADRRRYVLGRAILKMLLAHYAATRPEEISFQFNPFGKPELRDSEICFNMSKSADRVIVGLTRNRRIGVDIEHIRNLSQMDRVAKSSFSKNENKYLRAYPRNLMERGFFEIWTKKEAFVKAMGEGLNVPLQSFDVIGNPEEMIQIMRPGADQAVAGKWAICGLETGEDYAAAVAVEMPCSLPPRIFNNIA